jgi:hypothetical protein
MFPLDYVLAVALLATAPDCMEASTIAEKEEAADAYDAFVTVRPVLQAVALEWELLDPRETRYVMNRPEDFSGDVRLLRRRFSELHDAPPSFDCMRFPDRTLINELLKFNREYRQHLEARQATESLYWWELREGMLECDRIYQVWDMVREANCDYYYVTVRRQALKKLRENVGDPAFYSGVLPPHVPVWRFARIN